MEKYMMSLMKNNYVLSFNKLDIVNFTIILLYKVYNQASGHLHKD